MADSAGDDLIALLKARSVPRFQSERSLRGEPAAFTVPQLETLQKLATSIGKRPNLLRIAKEEVAELKSALNISTEALLREIALIVAAVGLTFSEAIYIGVNLEFKSLPLFYAVHAEQFLVARLKLDGEQLRALAVNAPPCGHCRQFLKELSGEGKLVIHTYARDTSNSSMGDNSVKGLMQPLDADGSGTIEASELEEALTRQQRTKAETYNGVQSLLPLGFGPDDLLPPGPRLLYPKLEELPNSISPYLGRNPKLDFVNPASSSNPLAIKALEIAKTAYSPYSESPSGVAIQLSDGFIGVGTLIESAAYNPTLSSVHSALVNCYAHKGAAAWSSIVRVVLVEKKGANVSMASILEVLMKLLAPTAAYEIHDIQ